MSITGTSMSSGLMRGVRTGPRFEYMYFKSLGTDTINIDQYNSGAKIVGKAGDTDEWETVKKTAGFDYDKTTGKYTIPKGLYLINMHLSVRCEGSPEQYVRVSLESDTYGQIMNELHELSSAENYSYCSIVFNFMEALEASSDYYFKCGSQSHGTSEIWGNSAANSLSFLKLD